MIFMTSFSAVAASEAFLYSRMKERTKYDHLSPMTRQVLRLSETLKLTTAELDMALVNLEKMSKVESRIKEVKKTIDFIGELRLIMARNQSSINRLIEFTTDYKSYFANKDLGWVYHVQLFYSDEKVVRHYNSLHVYLDDFEALLRYTHANFSYIADHKNEEHLKNYDEYYLRYRRAVDSHNKFNVQRIEFQNDFLIKYPGVKAYLPGERQTEAFRFWE